MEWLLVSPSVRAKVLSVTSKALHDAASSFTLHVFSFISCHSFFALSAPDTLEWHGIFLLFRGHSRHISIRGSLYLSFPLPTRLCPQMSTWLAPSLSSYLHTLVVTLPDIPCPPACLISCLLLSIAITVTWYTIYLLFLFFPNYSSPSLPLQNYEFHEGRDFISSVDFLEFNMVYDT